MALVQDACICLRKVEYSETSQILHLFSREHGIVRVIAKGAHRRTKVGASKFDGGVDLLDAGMGVFTDAPERDLGILTEWKLIDGRRELHGKLRSINLGLHAAELTQTLIEEHDPHADLYDRLEQTIGDIATDRAEESFLAFELDLLREAGYLPELFHCTSCGRDVARGDRAFFSTEQGGVLCTNCEGAFPTRYETDPRLLRMLQGILQLPRADGVPLRLPKLNRRQSDPINRLLTRHVHHTLGRRLAMAKYTVE